jgi:hypothetical protein
MRPVIHRFLGSRLFCKTLGCLGEGGFAEVEKRLNLVQWCEKPMDRGVFSAMKVVVGPLAQSGLESRVGTNLPAAVNTALVYYVGKLNSGRRPARYPKFLDTPGKAGRSEEAPAPDTGFTNPRPELEVEVDERIEAALFTDAESQGVSPSDLAGHAVLLYLAELDLIGDPEPPDPARTRTFSARPRRVRGTAH